MTESKTLWTVLLVTLTLVGCATEGAASGGAATSEGGSLGLEAPPDSEPSWVVAISSLDAEGEHRFCTATVIGPYAALTHGDCVGVDPSETDIVLGDDTRHGYRIPAAEVFFAQDAPGVAVVLSDEPLPTEVAQLALRPLDDIGEATVVGYGATGGGASILGLKHEIPVQVEVHAVDGTFARLSAADIGLCFGDLGAPLVHDGVVVGFVSELGPTCVPEASTFARSLERAAELLDAHAENVPGETDAGDSVRL